MPAYDKAKCIFICIMTDLDMVHTTCVRKVTSQTSISCPVIILQFCIFP